MVTIRMPLLCQALAKEFSDQLLSCVSDGRIHTLPLKTSYEKFERVRRKWHAAHVLVPNEAVDFASLADKAAAELEPVLLPCDRPPAIRLLSREPTSSHTGDPRPPYDRSTPPC
jgi:hypothetical protein